MNHASITFLFAILAVTAQATPVPPTAGDAFSPPSSYLAIRYPEYGGGPVRVYSAEQFSSITELAKTPEGRIIWVISEPPTTATNSVVAGLFALTLKDGKWKITDAKRFEASGKYAGAKAYLTGSATLETQTPLRITVTLHQGGRGEAWEESASYVVTDGRLVLALPKERQSEKDGPANSSPNGSRKKSHYGQNH